MEVVLSHKLEIIAFLFAASELLALIPSIKSNSVFTLAYNLLKKMAGK